MARRKGPGDPKAEALGKGLKTMFGRLERRPVPQALRDVVDQLDAGVDAAKPAKTKR